MYPSHLTSAAAADRRARFLSEAHARRLLRAEPRHHRPRWRGRWLARRASAQPSPQPSSRSSPFPEEAMRPAQ